jgi:hypothetical protein
MSQKSVKFHIESGDYFGTLATVLSLIEQTIGDSKLKRANVKTLNHLEKDLLFLQRGYTIVKK